MRNQTKFMAVLSAAALMSVAAPGITSNTNAYAATNPASGWVEDDGEWFLYDSDGYEVTDTWRKENGELYYLDSDGKLARNTRVDEYYVGENGRRVINQWINMHNEEDESSPEAPESYHYYYGKDGKAMTSQWAIIEGKHYYFNGESQMQTGLMELNGDTFYLGEDGDGAMRTGWVSLEDQSDDPDSDFNWHYFHKDGKMVMNQIDRKIEGAYYTFVEGKMQTGWYKLPVTADENATASNAQTEKKETVGDYQYYDEDGKRAASWRTLEGIQGIHDTSDEYEFFFKDGKAHHATSGIQVFNINSKKYAFNEKGEMQTDLQVVNLGNDEIANYYFGKDGVMKTGKQTIYSEDLDMNQTWFFHTDGGRKGQGYHGIKDNVIYVYGLRQEASDDLRYAPATLNDTRYLVNTSGSIQKSSSSSTSATKPELGKGFKDYKDNNDTVWVVDVNGVIQ